MPEPWWRTDPQDVYQLDDRITSVYVERSHIDRDENAVVLVNKERTVRVPAAMIAVMLVGPGTRITHGAITLLADSGTAMCWVGGGGVRMYACGLGASRGSRLLMRQAYLVTRTTERLAVARRMYAMRFPDETTDGLTMQQLRGREGARVRKIYRDNAQRTGVPWQRREYKPGDAFAAGDDVNRVLSAANSVLYGICHAVIAGIGASPAMGFVHTGSAVSFVLDIADLYKADYTIPLAFDLAAHGLVSERDARIGLRERAVDGKLMPQIVKDIKNLLIPDEEDLIDRELNALWDDSAGTLPGGTNWSDTVLDEAHYLSVVGPTLDKPEERISR
jgi:CRISPR-associated protein Cas1